MRSFPPDPCRRARWSRPSDCSIPPEGMLLTRRCSSSFTRTISRNLPFTKLGLVSEEPLASLQSGKGLSPYHAQTCRRLQAGSRLRKSCQRLRRGCRATLQPCCQFVADGGIGRLKTSQLGMNLRGHHEDRKLSGQPVERDHGHRHQKHRRNHADENVGDDQPVPQSPENPRFSASETLGCRTERLQ